VARDVVRQLVDRRAREVTGIPGAEGAATTLPGSPAAVADAAARHSLLTAGLSYRRLRLSAQDVSVVAASPDRAVVRVTTEASGYDVVDERGLVRSRVPPSRGSPTLLHLVRTGQGWRVATVTAP
jgi:hypothetical protein